MFVRFDDWSRLPGAEVEIWIDGSQVRIGLIDDATDDSLIVWVAADGNNHRCLLEKGCGVELGVSRDEMVRCAAWPI